MKFYTGLHQPNQAAHVERAFISVNRVRGRKKPVPGKWIMDSGAFTELATHGGYRHGVAEYAAEVNRLAAINPGLEAVVSQDWMCEAWMIEKTGLSVAEHQRLTIERFDDLQKLIRGVPLMPVLQGYSAAEYLAHIDQYGDRLRPGMLVGVGSVCKRNGNPAAIEEVLTAIKRKRPDLRLHGFGLKTTALGSDLVRQCLYSADSMAWSFAARRQGRDGNDWQEAQRFAEKIKTMPVQGWLFNGGGAAVGAAAPCHHDITQDQEETQEAMMTKKQYIDALEKLGLTPYAAARLLGISLRQSHRYASGEQPVKETVAILLAMYLKHGIPREWR